MDVTKIMAMGAGNILEWYDFAVFGALADVIGEQFFPKREPQAALMLSLSVFGSAFLMRPFGGIFLGYIGDTIGRKRALEMSVVLMLIPSCLMGCLMPYESWGIYSTILMIALRLLQGAAVGGELVGAFIFTIEHTNGQNRGLWGALCKSSGIWGTATGMGVVAILRISLTKAELYAWGWRIPFLMTIIIGLLGIWLRRYLSESDDFIKLQESQNIQNSPIFKTIRNYWLEILCIILIASFWCVGYYTCYIWMVYYMSSMIGDETVTGAWLINFLMMLILIFLLPIAGQTADILGIRLKDVDGGYRLVMMTGCILMLICGVPAFILINYHRWWSACMGQILFGIALACHGGNLPAVMVMLFPVDVRYTGIGIAYNVANALFAGTAPLIQTAIVAAERGPQLSSTGHLFPSFYLCASAIISFLSLKFLMPYVQTRRKHLDEVYLNEIVLSTHGGNKFNNNNNNNNHSSSNNRDMDNNDTSSTHSSITAGSTNNMNSVHFLDTTGDNSMDGGGGGGGYSTSSTSNNKRNKTFKSVLKRIIPGRVGRLDNNNNQYDDHSGHGHSHSHGNTSSSHDNNHRYSSTGSSTGNDVDSTVHSQTPLTSHMDRSTNSNNTNNTNSSSRRQYTTQSSNSNNSSHQSHSINPMRHTSVVNESLTRQENRRRVATANTNTNANTLANQHMSPSAVHSSVSYSTNYNINNNSNNSNSTPVAYPTHNQKPLAIGSGHSAYAPLSIPVPVSTNTQPAESGLRSSSPGITRIPSNYMTGAPSGRNVLQQTKTKVNVNFMP